MIRISRRQTVDEEVNSEGSWALSYGDMVTLLLMFFVMFFSTDAKVKEKEKNTLIQEELLAVFEKDQKQEFSTKPGNVPDESLKDLKIDSFKIGQRLIVVFHGVSFFNSSKTEITSGGAAALVEFTHRYLPYAGTHSLGIRAFTDERPVVTPQRFKDNLELSALRSVSAMRVLQKAGIPLQDMKLGGYGENHTTAEDLRKIASTHPGKIGDSKGDPLARKIALVIEPKPKESL
jgi:flagellar motor protein MotB